MLSTISNGAYSPLEEMMTSQAWAEAIEGYLSNERAGGKRRETLGLRRQHLQHFARRTTRPPWAVTADDLIEYFAAQEWALETRRGRRTTFVRFYDWGVYRGFVRLNPAVELQKVKMVQGVPRPAPDRAYHEALIAARPRERVMLRLAAEVGLRRSEVSLVHTDDLMRDLVGYSLVVHGKGGKTRIVPLPDSLGRTLDGFEHGFVFPGRDGGHLSPRYVGKMLRDLLPGDWTMHTLRHRFATKLYAHTSDLLMVQGVLGHSSPTTTQRYVALAQDRARSAIQELAG